MVCVTCCQNEKSDAAPVVLCGHTAVMTGSTSFA